jgi:hypothetical protein
VSIALIQPSQRVAVVRCGFAQVLGGVWNSPVNLTAKHEAASGFYNKPQPRQDKRVLAGRNAQAGASAASFTLFTLVCQNSL